MREPGVQCDRTIVFLHYLMMEGFAPAPLVAAVPEGLALPIALYTHPSGVVPQHGRTLPGLSRDTPPAPETQPLWHS